jgi:O-6-methylguanine DNA methyltransferase
MARAWRRLLAASRRKRREDPRARAPAIFMRAGGDTSARSGSRAKCYRWVSARHANRSLLRPARYGWSAAVPSPRLRGRARHSVRRSTTYGALAKRAGAAGAARAVGQALARNPFAIIVPCHRVLAAGGKPGGFSANGGAATKLRLLAIEDHKIGPAKGLVKSVKGNRAPSLFDSRAAVEG